MAFFTSPIPLPYCSTVGFIVPKLYTFNQAIQMCLFTQYEHIQPSAVINIRAHGRTAGMRQTAV